MQPLEAVLTEEEKQVVGAEIEDRRLAAKWGMPPPSLEWMSKRDARRQLLPYAAHQPYFDIIVGRGVVLRPRIQGLGSKVRELGASPDMVDFATSVSLFFVQTAYLEMARVMKLIKEKHNIDATEEGITTYLVGFAGRILDYVKSSTELQRIIAEQSTLSQLIERYKPHEIIRQLQKDYKLDMAFSIECVRRFYENSMR